MLRTEPQEPAEVFHDCEEEGNETDDDDWHSISPTVSCDDEIKYKQAKWAAEKGNDVAGFYLRVNPILKHHITRSGQIKRCCHFVTPEGELRHFSHHQIWKALHAYLSEASRTHESLGPWRRRRARHEVLARRNVPLKRGIKEEIIHSDGKTASEIPSPPPKSVVIH